MDRNYTTRNGAHLKLQSSPARGTWIEMGRLHPAAAHCASSPARGTWIEISQVRPTTVTSASSPARGTWIEIGKLIGPASDGDAVVPRKGDVDRNHHEGGIFSQARVVPRKGDVDRNDIATFSRMRSHTSSPARGTWIEIGHAAHVIGNQVRRPPQGGRG